MWEKTAGIWEIRNDFGSRNYAPQMCSLEEWEILAQSFNTGEKIDQKLLCQKIHSPLVWLLNVQPTSATFSSKICWETDKGGPHVLVLEFGISFGQVVAIFFHLSYWQQHWSNRILEGLKMEITWVSQQKVVKEVFILLHHSMAMNSSLMPAFWDIPLVPPTYVK